MFYCGRGAQGEAMKYQRYRGNGKKSNTGIEERTRMKWAKR